MWCRGVKSLKILGYLKMDDLSKAHIIPHWKSTVLLMNKGCQHRAHFWYTIAIVRNALHGFSMAICSLEANSQSQRALFSAEKSVL